MPPHIADIPVTDRTHLGEVRRRARAMASECGLSEDAAARLDLVAAEAATNILRHGGDGAILLNPTPPPYPPAVLLLAADSGPGIPDIQEAMADGYSTTGGMGGGLGALQRQSNWLDIYSRPGQGVVVAAAIADNEAPLLPRACGLLAPAPGERVCGDGWAVREAGGAIWALMCDGLGHGEKAASAAATALDAFATDALRGPAEAIAMLDRALVRERGAAALVARIVPEEGWAEAAGVGNISGAILGPEDRVQRLVSQGGVVGGGARTPTPVRYDWPAGATMILSSDGIRTIHDFGAWPGLMERAPLTIAGAIHRDRTRRSDDAGLLVVQGGAG